MKYRALILLDSKVIYNIKKKECGHSNLIKTKKEYSKSEHGCTAIVRIIP